MKKGVKYDRGKLRYSLVPQEVIDSLAKVLTFGANKYEKDGWKSVEPFEERYTDALHRHLSAHAKGELIDEESGLLHIEHALANIAFLTWHAVKERDVKQFVDADYLPTKTQLDFLKKLYKDGE